MKSKCRKNEAKFNCMEDVIKYAMGFQEIKLMIDDFNNVSTKEMMPCQDLKEKNPKKKI